MPTIVDANDGDNLCSLAIAAGFLDCGQIRSDPANAGKEFLTRDLKKGDVVTIPDIKKNILAKAAEMLHKFKKKNAPPIQIRFVHGSRDTPYRDDTKLTFLNVSNYVPDKAGADGTQTLPKGFGFNQNGHDDQDTYKVEVVDPRGGSEVMVELEALKPTFAVGGSINGHESFSDAQANLRKIKVQCKKVSNPNYKGFRSRYLRLVVDEVDIKAISSDPVATDGTAQGLFTSDMADGNDGDADKVEILDQLVQATYVIKNCKASAPHKCKVRDRVEIAPDKQRIKLCFHVFRATAGVAGTRSGGVTDKALHRRTAKWYRRAYAQAGLAPILVGPKIEELDPPPPDMLILGQPNGGSASGLTAAGAGSVLRFDLEVHPKGGGAPSALVNVSLNLQALVVANAGSALTAAQVAADVVAALPAGFAGKSFAVQPAYSSASAPVDILISHSDDRVFIRNESCDDAGITATVARVNLASVDASALLPPYSPSIRRISHAGTISDDQMDCFVIAAWSNKNLRGFALIPDADLPDIVLADGTHIGRQAQAPGRWANIMAMQCNSDAGGPFAGAEIATLDDTDSLPYTYPHESGHVMMDAIHALNTTEMMRGGTVEQNELRGSKRICDDPVHIEYQLRGAVTIPGGAVTNVALSAVQRLRTKGAQVMQPW